MQQCLSLFLMGVLLSACTSSSDYELVEAKKIYSDQVYSRIAALSIARSPNKQLVAIGDTYGSIKIWDAKTWQALRNINQPASAIVALHFISDDTLLSISERGVINRWNLKTGKSVKHWLVAKDGKRFGRVNDASFSLNKEWIYVKNGNKALVYNLKQAKAVVSFLDYDNEINTISFSVEGNAVVVLDGRNRLYKINLTEPNKKIDLTLDRDLLNNIKYASKLVYFEINNRLIALESNGAIGSYDFKKKAMVKLSTRAKQIAISKDGLFLSILNDKYHYQLYDLKADKIVFTYDLSKAGKPVVMSLSANAKQVLLGGISRVNNNKSSGFVLMELDRKTARVRYTVKLEAKKVQPKAIAYTSDGKYFITASENGDLNFWNANTGHFIYSKATDLQGIQSLSVNQHPDLVAGITGSIKAFVYDIKSKKYKFLVKLMGRHQRQIAIDPKGEILATGGQFDCIKLWNLKQGNWSWKAGTQDKDHHWSAVSKQAQQRGSLAPACTSRSTSSKGNQRVLYDKTGKYLVLQSGKYQLKIRDRTGKLIKKVTTKGRVIQFDLSSDGKLLSAIGRRGYLYVWPILEKEPPLIVKINQRRQLTSLSYSNDNKRLYVGAKSGNFYTFDIKQKKITSLDQSVLSNIIAISVHPKKKLVASVHGNGSVYFRHAETGVAIAKLTLHEKSQWIVNRLGVADYIGSENIGRYYNVRPLKIDTLSRLESLSKYKSNFKKENNILNGE